MTAIVAWGAAALAASAALMLLVLAVRLPVRHWLGPCLGYALWAIPAVRLILPPLPVFSVAPAATGTVARVLFAGPRGALVESGVAVPSVAAALVAIWLAGAVAVLAVCTLRHAAFCRRVRATGSDAGRHGGIDVIAADVAGPLAFGVFRRFIAVPRGFTSDYSPAERDLALAHEAAHHARGDLLANWVSLVVLAVHWWNPIAWAAIRAFRDDQEFAADAHVLSGRTAAARSLYARVLAKTAGVGALPACNLTARSTLKGRLMMLGHTPPSRRHIAGGSIALALLGGTALAATATPPPATGAQAVTIGVKPDGAGGYALIVGGKAAAPGARLPGGKRLPAGFDVPDKASGCNLTPAAKPNAMVIKGEGATTTYTVMCASAAPAPVRVTLTEGLASLTTMRASIATQAASAAFPEAERVHALGAVDRSIAEVKATLARR